MAEQVTPFCVQETVSAAQGELQDPDAYQVEE